ncbi:S-adenosyl-L-methionine-dependent methyltransferase [Acephala macrosclerotiorum]|nr:S-adenosyl-L-methionine-dependent methyltransferase [Acephala macrosclerotiorum]
MEGPSRKRFAHDLEDTLLFPTKRRKLKWSSQEHFDEHTEDELDSSESQSLKLSWTSWSPLTKLDTDEEDDDKDVDDEAGDYELENVNIVKTTSFVFSQASEYYPNVLREIKTPGSPSPRRNLYSRDLKLWKEKFGIIAKTNLPKRITSSSSSNIGNFLDRKFYSSVDNDGSTFSPGDFVLTEGPLFARIISVYQQNSDGGYIAHLQMFQHGSDIPILKQLASPVELFHTTKCTDMPIDSFGGKIKVTREPDSEAAVIVEQNYELGEYFYRLSYDSEKQRFLDVPDVEGQPQGPECPFCIQNDNNKDREKQCAILGTKHKMVKSKIFLEGIRHAGTAYRVHDFVYIFEALEPKQPFTIGQITRICTKRRHWFSPSRTKKTIDYRCIKITVDIFERYDKLLNASWFYEFEVHGGKHAVRDERRLYRTRAEMKITPNELEGKCWVRPYADFGGIHELDAFKDKANHFWVKDQVKEGLDLESEIGCGALVPLEELEFSHQTKEEMQNKNRRLENFLKQPGTKLRGLDIFSGAGGLSLGMQSSGLVDPDTLHAIEFDAAACKTHATNFPKCIMHNADACPPCQGFSTINRHKKAEDPKNALVAMYLGYVELYRPKYFLLENVNGLLHNKLGATEVLGGEGKAICLEGGIEQGTVKLIFRCLTGLGYQVQFALLEAAEYNVASTRKRVIFWASLPDHPLPFFPQATNILPRKISRIGDSALTNWYRNNRSAPHEMITMGAAITDLPPFDWENSVVEEMEARLRRDHRSIQSYPVDMASRFVGKDLQLYPSTRPLSEYQRRLCRDEARDAPLGRLRNHVTNRYRQDLVDLVSTVPVTETNNPNGRKTYRRMDIGLPLTTCLTTVRPDQKAGNTIHPTQHRVISIRESARAMSFPDSFFFNLNIITAVDAYKQIGNAVPPNFAHALASELVIARMEKHERQSLITGPTFTASKPKNTGKIVDFIDLTGDDD